MMSQDTNIQIKLLLWVVILTAFSQLYARTRHEFVLLRSLRLDIEIFGFLILVLCLR